MLPVWCPQGQGVSAGRVHCWPQQHPCFAKTHMILLWTPHDMSPLASLDPECEQQGHPPPSRIPLVAQFTFPRFTCCLMFLHLLPLQASGYVEFDTAGQSNMYPVITRAYETGSDQDTLETGSANLVVGVGAGVIAVAVLALGLVALSQQGGAGESCSLGCGGWGTCCFRCFLRQGRGVGLVLVHGRSNWQQPGS